MKNALTDIFIGRPLLESPNTDWKVLYASLLGTDWEGHEAKYEIVLHNPYYAVVNTVAYILKHGNFRGYEHFSAAYFSKDSPNYVGILVEKERTRTDWGKGNYVTDWYVKADPDTADNIYRATCYILLSSIARTPPSLLQFTKRTNLIVRERDDGNNTPQISG